MHIYIHKKSVGLFARYAILSVLYKNKKDMIFFSSDNKSKSWLRWSNIIYNGLLLKSEGEWKLGPGQVIFSVIKICKNKYGMSRKIIIIVYTVQLSFHFMPQLTLQVYILIQLMHKINQKLILKVSCLRVFKDLWRRNKWKHSLHSLINWTSNSNRPCF